MAFTAPLGFLSVWRRERRRNVWFAVGILRTYDRAAAVALDYANTTGRAHQIRRGSTVLAEIPAKPRA